MKSDLDDDYILSDEKEFEFLGEDEDKWITTFLIMMNYFIKNYLHDDSKSENKWKLSSENDEHDLKDKYDSSDDENINTRGKKLGKKM